MAGALAIGQLLFGMFGSVADLPKTNLKVILESTGDDIFKIY